MTRRCSKELSAKLAMLTFPFPLNADVVSQPVNAWNIGNVCDLESPRVAHIIKCCRI